LPIVETEAQNISAYIPTNIISITDGQIYLSPDLFQKGILPSVDVGKSVSRVGGKTQLAAYRAVASDLRLSYSQFEELEAFARFGTRLDEETRKTLERGRRVREILKQSQYEPIPVPEQIAALIAVTAGIFDDYSADQIGEAEREVRNAIVQQLPGVWERIQSGDKLSREDYEALVRMARKGLDSGEGEEKHANGRVTEEKNQNGGRSSLSRKDDESPGGRENPSVRKGGRIPNRIQSNDRNGPPNTPEKETGSSRSGKT
jgi:F-type H+-transporting ATPase subunit alpha